MTDDDFDNALWSCYGPLLRYTQSLLSPEAAGDLAEDVAQDTLVAALAARRGFRGASSMLTWLCGIARRRLATLYRHDNRPLDEAVAGPGPPDTEISEAVQHALESLPPRQAHALLLRHVLGLSVAEVAQEMGWTYATAATMLKRARRRFRAVYRP